MSRSSLAFVLILLLVLAFFYNASGSESRRIAEDAKEGVRDAAQTSVDFVKDTGREIKQEASKL